MNDVTHVDDGEHVLEGGVGEKQEERAVDVHDAGLVVDSGGLCPDPGGGPGDQQHYLIQPSYHHRYTISYNSHTIIGNRYTISYKPHTIIGICRVDISKILLITQISFKR